VSHKIALITVATAAVLDAVAGTLFAATEHIAEMDGLYWAITTATTVGYGDFAPHTHVGKALAVVVMLTVVPLFAATFSLFTSALTSGHVKDSEDRLKEHLEERLDEHHTSIVSKLGGRHG
jgi:voltage-gated potassium channel